MTLVAANFSAICEGFNASTVRQDGFEYYLEADEIDALSMSLVEALPHGEREHKVIERERIFWKLDKTVNGTGGLPSEKVTTWENFTFNQKELNWEPGSLRKLGDGGTALPNSDEKGLCSVKLTFQLRWVKEDVEDFKIESANTSVFYVLDQFESALTGDRGTQRWTGQATGVDDTSGLKYWANYFNAPSLDHLYCPLDQFVFPSTFKVLTAGSPTALPTNEPTQVPTFPFTPPPTSPQWFSINATTDFGAKGGDRIMFKGTGLHEGYWGDSTVFQCVFSTFRRFRSKGVAFLQRYTRMTSDLVVSQRSDEITCITPRWGEEYPAQEAALALIDMTTNRTVPFSDRDSQTINDCYDTDPKDKDACFDFVYDFYLVIDEISFYPGYWDGENGTEFDSPEMDLYGGGLAKGGQFIHVSGYGFNTHVFPGTNGPYICQFVSKRQTGSAIGSLGRDQYIVIDANTTENRASTLRNLTCATPP